VTYKCYVHWARKYAARTNSSAADVTPAGESDVAHLLETHLCIAGARRGKRYKDWLLDHADAGECGIGNGVSVLIREVVKERLRREFSHRSMLPIEGHELPTRDDRLDPVELLTAPATPSEAVIRRELENTARAVAVDYLDMLSHGERIVLLCRELSVPVDHPAVHAATGVRKSQVSHCYHRTVRRLAAWLRDQYPEDDSHVLLFLCRLALMELGRMIIMWGRAEKRCARLFIVVEGQQVVCNEPGLAPLQGRA
jgi:hypothetical protein